MITDSEKTKNSNQPEQGDGKMIINAKTGRKLVSTGNAKIESPVVLSDGRRYAAITRYDVQRTDHYQLKDGENN